MKMIYNEGRVVGLSAYELYLRQLLSLNPEATPMTEREWLTNTLSNNTSMILRIPANTTKGVHDYVLPQGSNLAACCQIFGSMFQGDVTLDESEYWATSVTDFGDSISNDDQRSPQTPGTPEYVPSKEDPTQENQKLIERAEEFIKIRQMIVLQPGEWQDTSEEIEAPAKYLEPDLHASAFVRILLLEETVNDLYILIHGFVDKVMLMGEVSFPYQGESLRPYDGDFLGPAVFPWSCTVTLIISSEIAGILVKQQREINDRFNDAILDLTAHTLYLGTLHTAVWDAGLANQYSESILTENNDVILVTKEGTVAEMWEDGVEPEIVYFVPWLDEDEEELVSESNDTIWVPKKGTFRDMVDEGGRL